MELLTRCAAQPHYEYAANNPQMTTESIRNDDELYAAVPIGAAKLEAKLHQFGQLNVNMTIVGRWEAAKGDVLRSELRGAECDRATHVITAMSVGAFTFYAGAEDAAGGQASVVGVGAGANATRTRENLSQAGEPAKCAKATDQDKQPVTNCSAVIRVEVAALGATPGRTSAEVQCPEGTVKQDGACAPVSDRSCSAGMHFAEGRGCVPDYAEPTGPVRRFKICAPADATKCSDWFQTGSETWNEVQYKAEGQSDRIIRFRFSQRIETDGMRGTVLLRLPEEAIEVFVPDKQSERMWVRFRSPPGAGEWQYLAEMTNIE